MMASDHPQERAMVQVQIMDLYDHLDRELMQLIGGHAHGSDLEAAKAAVAAATKRTAALIKSIGGAHPCK